MHARLLDVNLHKQGNENPLNHTFRPLQILLHQNHFEGICLCIRHI
jgi:hypothetical protein